MRPENQPSHPSNVVAQPVPLDSGRVAASGYQPPVPPVRVPVRRMPRLGRCVTRAFVHVAKKRYYVGRYDNPAVQELYARLTRVWDRTGHIDLSLIREARTPSAGNKTTIAELGEQFRHHAEQRYVNRDGTLSSEFHNFRIAWRVVRELFGSTPAEKFGPRKLREVQGAMATLRKQNGDGWCRKNINKQISRIRLIFNWAVAEEIVPVQVADALKHVRGLRRGEQDVRESEAVTPVPQAEQVGGDSSSIVLAEAALVVPRAT